MPPQSTDHEEEYYSTLEVNTQAQSPQAGLETYHPEFSQYKGNGQADLEAYHPGHRDDDGIILDPAEEDGKMIVTDGGGDKEVVGKAEEKDQGKKKVVILRGCFWAAVVLFGLIAAGLVAGLVVGLRSKHSSSHAQTDAPATSLPPISSTSLPPISSTSLLPISSTSATPSSVSTSPTATPTTAITKFGAEVTDCAKNSTNFFLGEPSSTCYRTNTTDGFEVTRLQSNCTSTGYTDVFCSDNATGIDVGKCYNGFESFSVDDCN